MSEKGLKMNYNVMKLVKGCLLTHAILHRSGGKCTEGSPETVEKIMDSLAKDVFPANLEGLMAELRECLGKKRYQLAADLSLITLIGQSDMTVAEVCSHLSFHTTRS